MKRSSFLLCALAAASLLLFASASVPACYSAVPNDGLVDACVPASTSSPPSSAIGPGNTCEAQTGTVPAGNCHLPWKSGAEDCSTICTACTVPSSSLCGDSRTCMPLPGAKNGPTVYDFRMEALHVILPVGLNGLLQTEALTPGVTLNAPLCGNAQSSPGVANSYAGGLNWLIRLDRSTQKITTGGASMVADPYQEPYAFLNKVFPNPPYASELVAPVCLDADIADTPAGIAFSSSPANGILNIPIFLPGDRVTLPIRGVEFHDVTISQDGNCIGDINQGWYAYGSNLCNLDDLNACPKWYTAGAVAGYVELEEADKVVLAIGESLCYALVGTPPMPANGHCTAAELMNGDYCSATGKPCTHGDSVSLAATFAANAVKIDDAGAPACK